MIPANQIYEVRLCMPSTKEWIVFEKTSSYDFAFEVANNCSRLSQGDRKIFNVTDPENEFEEGTVSK